MASPIELKLVRDTADSQVAFEEEITLVHSYNPKPGNGVDDISESIPLFLEGSQATVRASIAAINNMLAQARERNEKGYGDNIYLMTRTGGTAESWRRSRILDGRLSVTDGGIVAGLTSGARTAATLTITRNGYFDDNTLINAPFYNSNGTASEDWINVFNCNSGAGTAPNKLVNYAILNAANIRGDLPAPVSVSLTNVNAGTSIKKYIVSLAAIGSGTADPSYFTKDFSGTADATCSGGSAAVSSLSTDAETDMFTANINGSAAFLQFGGAPYHVVARFANNTSLANVKFRLKFKSGTTTIWTGPQFILPNTDIIQDLGIVNLPPGVPYTWGDGNLVITGQRTTGVTETITLDFIQFFGGTYAELTGLTPVTSSYGIGYGGIWGGVSHSVSGGYLVRDWIVYGGDALMLQPGKSNLFLVLAQTTAAGTAAINMNHTFEVFYRPRWSSPL